MYCCANCFDSPTLKDHIDSEGSIDDCDFCSSEGIKTVAVSSLYQFFEPIFGMYREIEYGRDYFSEDDPIDHGELLPRLVENDWSPFSDDFNYDRLHDFFDSLIPTPIHKDDIEDYLDLSSLYTDVDRGLDDSWHSFSYYLRNTRRFIIEDESLQHFTEFLPEVLSGIEVKVGKDEKYYRARLGSGDQRKHLPKEEMGTPPPEKTLSGGRANPPGIPFLYLSDNLETAVSEVRPWKGATASVATFQTLKEIRLIDLTADFYIDDPFAYGEELQFVVSDNRLLRRLGRELSKPVNPLKTSIEYVPTQYVTEIIRNLEYDGMIYPSALGKGKNIVLFDESVVRCEDVNLYQVKSVGYNISDFDPWEADSFDL